MFQITFHTLPAGVGEVFYIYFALLQSFQYLPTIDMLHYTIP